MIKAKITRLDETFYCEVIDGEEITKWKESDGPTARQHLREMLKSKQKPYVMLYRDELNLDDHPSPNEILLLRSIRLGEKSIIDKATGEECAANYCWGEYTH